MLGAENLTLKQVLDLLAKRYRTAGSQLQNSARAWRLGVAYAETAFSRLIGREPQIPVEGVKIAQHLMFVDCARAQRELGFQTEPVAAAFGRAVRWYEKNGYISERRIKRMAHAVAA